MDIQRLRNLTTERLHTDISHVYQDIGYIVGEKGIMTHEIPNALKAIKPYLMSKINDNRFWNGEYDPTHQGEIDVPPMDHSEKEEFWERYSGLPSLLNGKNVIAVIRNFNVI